MFLFARLLFLNVTKRGQGVWLHKIRSKRGPNINSELNGSCPQFLSLQPYHTILKSVNNVIRAPSGISFWIMPFSIKTELNKMALLSPHPYPQKIYEWIYRVLTAVVTICHMGTEIWQVLYNFAPISIYRVSLSTSSFAVSLHFALFLLPSTFLTT